MQEKTTNVTRRCLLKCGSLAVMSIATPSDVTSLALFRRKAAQSASSAPSSPSDATIARLSAYMNEAGERSLPEDVVEKAKHHMVDTIAAMISGIDLPPARVALNFARTHPGDKVATVVGSNLVCGALEACGETPDAAALE